ncbi:MAG TPA: PqqD family protein [Polyangia bacterium]
MWRNEPPPAGADAGDAPASILLLHGTMLSLNGVGTEIWRRCTGVTATELVAALAPEFEVEPAVLERDVSAFLADLARHGFVEEA